MHGLLLIAAISLASLVDATPVVLPMLKKPLNMEGFKAGVVHERGVLGALNRRSKTSGLGSGCVGTSWDYLMLVSQWGITYVVVTCLARNDRHALRISL